MVPPYNNPEGQARQMLPQATVRDEGSDIQRRVGLSKVKQTGRHRRGTTWVSTGVSLRAGGQCCRTTTGHTVEPDQLCDLWFMA